jgi:hypothetical protein
VKLGPTMTTRKRWKEMMNFKTMMAMYTTRHHPTQTSSFDILMHWIVIPSIYYIVSVQLQMEYKRKLNRNNMARKSYSILF